MPRTTLTITFIFLYLCSKSQLTTGVWIIGGNATFSSSKSKAAEISDATTELELSPSLGYFIFDRLPLGIKVDIYAQKDKENTAARSYYNVILNPFVRYYILSNRVNSNLFIEANYGYGFTKVKGVRGTEEFSSYSLLGGPVIYFNSSVGLEFTAGYYHDKQSGIDFSRSRFQFGIGLKVHLEKND